MSLRAWLGSFFGSLSVSLSLVLELRGDLLTWAVHWFLWCWVLFQYFCFFVSVCTTCFGSTTAVRLFPSYLLGLHRTSNGYPPYDRDLHSRLLHV